MPRGDSTGPMGLGPRSGRGAGYCGGFGVPGYANSGGGPGRGGWGRGFGSGFAGGWGRWLLAAGLPAVFGYGGYARRDPELERQELRGQASALQVELEAIRRRLDELEAGSEK